MDKTAHLTETDLMRYVDDDRRVQKRVINHLLHCKDCLRQVWEFRDFERELADLRNGTNTKVEIEKLNTSVAIDLALKDIARRHKQSKKK